MYLHVQPLLPINLYSPCYVLALPCEDDSGCCWVSVESLPRCVAMFRPAHELPAPLHFLWHQPSLSLVQVLWLQHAVFLQHIAWQKHLERKAFNPFPPVWSHTMTCSVVEAENCLLHNFQFRPHCRSYRLTLLSGLGSQLALPQTLLQIESGTATLHKAETLQQLVTPPSGLRASGIFKGSGAPAQVKGRGAKPKYICSTPQEAIAKRYCQCTQSRAKLMYLKPCRFALSLQRNTFLSAAYVFSTCV